MSAADMQGLLDPPCGAPVSDAQFLINDAFLSLEDQTILTAATGCDMRLTASFDSLTGTQNWQEPATLLQCFPSKDDRSMLCGGGDGIGYTQVWDIGGSKPNLGAMRGGVTDQAVALEGGWIAASWDRLERVDAQSNAIWTVTLPEGGAREIQVAGDYVLVNIGMQYPGGYVVYDLSSGDLLASAQSSVGAITPQGVAFGDEGGSSTAAGTGRVTVIAGLAYFVETSSGPVVVVFEGDEAGVADPKTGDLRWSAPVGDAARVFDRTIVTSDGDERLVFSSYVDGINALFTVSLEGVPYEEFVVAQGAHWIVGDTVAVVDLEGMITGWTADGEVAWEVPGERLLASSDTTLLVAASEGFQDDPMGYDRFETVVAYSAALPSETSPAGGSSGESIEAALPQGVSCPSSMIPLSFGQNQDGWVLVCGYRSGIPEVMIAASNTAPSGTIAWERASGEWKYRIETTQVAYSPATRSYTGTVPRGTLIFSEAPAAFVQKGPSGESESQVPLVKICYVNLDTGASTCEDGAGQTGAYGVTTPDETAADQVRYLSEIIEASKATRAELGPAVTKVSEGATGQALRDAIATIESARDNRQTLIDALAVAPVDLVPDGTQLVNELTVALRASYNADVGYLDWARAVEKNGGTVPPVHRRQRLLGASGAAQGGFRGALEPRDRAPVRRVFRFQGDAVGRGRRRGEARDPGFFRPRLPRAPRPPARW